jgi:hypothetical protein
VTALVKSYQYNKLNFESALNHYANHIANYVQIQTGIMPAQNKSRVSLITAVGDDLIGNIISFVENEDRTIIEDEDEDQQSESHNSLSTMFLVCKTFNKFAMKRVWKKVKIRLDFERASMTSADTKHTLSFESRGVELVEELSLQFSSNVNGSMTDAISRMQGLKSLEVSFVFGITSDLVTAKKVSDCLQMLFTRHSTTLQDLRIAIFDSVFFQASFLPECLGEQLKSLNLKSFFCPSEICKGCSYIIA